MSEGLTEQELTRYEEDAEVAERNAAAAKERGDYVPLSELIYAKDVRGMLAEIRRLQEQEKRLLVMLAWTKGLIPSEAATYENCHRYMDQHNIHGDDFICAAARGRALVEAEQQKDAMRSIASLHRKMAGVTEEEVLKATEEPEEASK